MSAVFSSVPGEKMCWIYGVHGHLRFDLLKESFLYLTFAETYVSLPYLLWGAAKCLIHLCIVESTVLS